MKTACLKLIVQLEFWTFKRHFRRLIRHFRDKMESGSKMRPQVFLGSILGTRRSAIGQFFTFP